jgi:hypothetical protein
MRNHKSQRCKKLLAKGKIKLWKERGGKRKFEIRIFENVLKKGQGRERHREKLCRKRVKGIFSILAPLI